MTFSSVVLFLTRLLCIVPVISGKKELLSLELEIPRFLHPILGVDKNLKTFRASLAPQKDNLDAHEVALALSSKGRDTDDESDERETKDRELVKLNLLGANDVASLLMSLIQPYSGADSMLLVKSLQNLLRRSTIEETRPHVAMGQGTIKNERIKTPPNYFSKRLKYLMRLQEKEAKLNKKTLDKKENTENGTMAKE